jgi:hypothetical protein
MGEFPIFQTSPNYFWRHLRLVLFIVLSRVSRLNEASSDKNVHVNPVLCLLWIGLRII